VSSSGMTAGKIVLKFFGPHENMDVLMKIVLLSVMDRATLVGTRCVGGVSATARSPRCDRRDR
jgi:hypothetical protein